MTDCRCEAATGSGGEVYSSSVTVESDADGFHQITCNRTDVVTGNKSTTYHAKVKAPHLVTRVVVDDDGDALFTV